MIWRTKDRMLDWLQHNSWVWGMLIFGVLAALGIWGALCQPQPPVACAVYALDANRERVCICWSNEHCARRRSQ